MSCARVRAAVSGFEKDFGGRVQVRTIPNDSEEGVAARMKYDLQSHGIVLFSPAGEPIYKRSEHRVSADEVTCCSPTNRPRAMQASAELARPPVVLYETEPGSDRPRAVGLAVGGAHVALDSDPWHPGRGYIQHPMNTFR